MNDNVANNIIQVVYLKNPFKPQERVIKAFSGEEIATVFDAFKELGIETPAGLVVVVNGKHVEQAQPIRGGDYVVILPDIKGGGGGGSSKNIAGVIAGLALMAVTGGAAAAFLGGVGMAHTLGLGLALYFGGSLLTGNQKTPKVTASNNEFGAFEGGYSWSPDTVRVNPGGPIPVTFGTFGTSGTLLTRRIATGYLNDKSTQYLALLIGAGEGPLDSISDIKINGIPIASIAGATYETKLGTNEQTAIAIARLSEVSEFQPFNSELPISVIEWITKAQTEIGNSIVMDFVFPAGLYSVSATGALEIAVGVTRSEYREIGATEWLSAGGMSLQLSEKTRAPFYFRAYFTPPDPTKLYEFRFQNYSFKYNDDTFWHGAYTETPTNVSYSMAWVGLTVLNDQPQTYPGMALVALSIPATENLSGSMPKVTWKQSRNTILAWNPTEAEYQAKDATNIAWMVYDVIHKCKYLKNTQTDLFEYAVFGEPKENLNYTEFNNWATFCAETSAGVARAEGNLLLDTAGQMWSTVQRIAASGRGFIIQQANVFKPVWDSVKTVSQIFTAGNMSNITGAFIADRERATAIEATFINEDKNYETDTLFVPGDDYSPAGLANPTQINIPGITKSDAVYMLCKQMLKKNKYLRRTANINVGIDSLAAELGDAVGIQSDVSSWGVGGRVLGATTTSVVIDQEVSMVPGTTYSLLVRYPDDTLVRRTVNAVLVPTTTTTLAFTVTPWAVAPDRFAVYSFGVQSLEIKPFTITSIRRSNDLDATIELIEYIEGVFTEDTNFPVIDYTAIGASLTSLTVNPDAENGRLHVAWIVPPDKDYQTATVYVDGKPQGFLNADNSTAEIDLPPGTYTVIVLPLDGNGNAGTPEEVTVTLGSPTLEAVSDVVLDSEIVLQGDGTGLVFITGTFTIPALATNVLVEIGEGVTPSAWYPVQSNRTPSLLYGPVKVGVLYTLRFSAYNRYAIATATLATITPAGDEIAPAAPVIFRISNYMKNVAVGVLLADAPGDVAGFIVYRNTVDTFGTATEAGRIASKTTLTTATAVFQDTVDVGFGTELYYWAKTFDTWGNVSAASPSVHFTMYGKLSDYVWLGDEDTAFWIGTDNPATAIVLMNPDGTGTFAGFDLTADGMSATDGTNYIALDSGTNGMPKIIAGKGVSDAPLVLINGDGSGKIANLPFTKDRFAETIPDQPLQPSVAASKINTGFELGYNYLYGNEMDTSGEGPYPQTVCFDGSTNKAYKFNQTVSVNEALSTVSSLRVSIVNLPADDYYVYVTISGNIVRRNAGALSGIINTIPVSPNLPAVPADFSTVRIMALQHGVVDAVDETTITLDVEAQLLFDNPYRLEIRLADESLVSVPILNPSTYDKNKHLSGNNTSLKTFSLEFETPYGTPPDFVGLEWALIPVNADINDWTEIDAKAHGYESAGISVLNSASSEKQSAILVNTFAAAFNGVDKVPFGYGDDTAKDAFYSPTDLRVERSPHHLASMTVAISADLPATLWPGIISDTGFVATTPADALAGVLSLSVLQITPAETSAFVNDKSFYSIDPAQYATAFPDLSDGMLWYRHLPEVLLKAFQEYVARDEAVTEAAADYTVLSADNIIQVTALAVITLPDATLFKGRRFTVDNAHIAEITVEPQAGQTIQGETSQSIPPDSAMMVYSDGVKWRII